MKWIWIAALTMVSAEQLPAQMIVEREPVLDSARVVLRDALFGLRDSLRTIDAAAARLQRDHQQASPALLVSRARVMLEACERSGRAVPSARHAVMSTRVNASGERRQRDMVNALGQLGHALAQCEREFGAMSKAGQSEEVRGYGNYRAAQVRSAMREYTSKANAYLASMGIKVRPPITSS